MRERGAGKASHEAGVPKRRCAGALRGLASRRDNHGLRQRRGRLPRHLHALLRCQQARRCRHRRHRQCKRNLQVEKCKWQRL